MTPGVQAVATIGIGLAVIAASLAWRPAWRLTYNPTPSAPRGWYALDPVRAADRSASVPIRRGDQVLVWPPRSAAQQAAVRGYLPLSVPLLKTVSALSGDTVCRFGVSVRVDGRRVAVALRKDRAGRTLPVWRGCHVLKGGSVFLLGQSSVSFDGRYFGPISSAALIARARPLWTW